MTGEDHYDLLNEEKICRNCGLHAPKRQIETLEGICERCSMDGYKIKGGEKLNPDNNLLDKWKYRTPESQNQSEGVV